MAVTFQRPRITCVLAGLLLAIVAQPAVAQQSPRDAAADDVPSLSPRPLLIINVASVDRLLSDVRYLFTAAGRGGINEQITEGITGFNDLKGLDRTKPLGRMIFLVSGLPPSFNIVDYVPVSNIESLVQTIAAGQGELKKVPAEKDRYEIVGARGNRQVLLRNGYAFISDDLDSLVRKFLDPVKLTASLSTRHDIAVTLKLNSVPDGYKNVLLDLLRASAYASLQQRDDESDEPYQIRRASGENVLEILDLVMTQGEQITIGINASAESKDVVLDVIVDAKKDSQFARSMKELGSKASYFGQLVDDKAPLSLSMSWVMDKREKGNLTEFLQLAEPRLAAQLEAVAPAVRDLFTALGATAQAGHLDAFFQFQGKPAGKMVIVGGLKVQQGKKLGAAAREVLREIQKNPEVGTLELDVDNHAGVSIHRMQVGQGQPAAEEGIYGRKPAVYLGTGPRAVWFAFGDSGALAALKQSIDKINSGRRRITRNKRGAPFQVVLNMNRWLESLDQESSFATLARQAFANGGDHLQVDIRPTDTGVRLRVRAEEGFIRLLGMSIGRLVDARSAPAAE